MKMPDYLFTVKIKLKTAEFADRWEPFGRTVENLLMAQQWSKVHEVRYFGELNKRMTVKYRWPNAFQQIF